MLDRKDIPRIKLINQVTPLERMANVEQHFGSRQRLFIKRDDLTGLAFGGNKTRKLEFTLADAIAKGATSIITSGGIQSNHVRQTAAAAAKVSLRCHAVVDNPLETSPRGSDKAYKESGNILCTRLFGCEVHAAAGGNDSELSSLIEEVRASELANGFNPYVVPLGASDAIGSLGYVAAANEIVQQIDEQGLSTTHIVCATGSAGTQAGLVLGLSILDSPIKVIGVAVSECAEIKATKVKNLIIDMCKKWNLSFKGSLDEKVLVEDGYVGAGYGFTTTKSEKALEQCAQLEGVLLDPVYTAKSMAYVFDLIEHQLRPESQDIIYLHTGGSPAIFGYL